MPDPTKVKSSFRTVSSESQATRVLLVISSLLLLRARWMRWMRKKAAAGEHKTEWSTLRDGTRRLIGLMDNRVHGYKYRPLVSLPCPRERHQERPSTFCPNTLALPQPNLAVSFASKECNCHLHAHTRSWHVSNTHPSFLPILHISSINIRVFLARDTLTSLACLTCIFYTVGPDHTTCCAASLYLALPLNFYRPSSHISMCSAKIDFSLATRDLRTATDEFYLQL